jgi:hypothetical protein
MRTIELPDHLYQRLEKLAIPFEDKLPADVIERLIDEANGDTTRSSQIRRIGGSSVSSRSGTIPHGTRLRKRYKGHDFEAEVRDGKIWLDATAYSSPSQAANAAANSIGMDAASINGWTSWEFLDTKSNVWLPLTESDGYKPT